MKTRLCPPCSFDEAAAIARAALADTLRSVAAVAARLIVVLEGSPGPWLPSGFEVLPQRGGGLDERLAAAFDDAGSPALLIGMDSPTVTAPVLEGGLAALRAGKDAVLGPAADGGWWAIGLRRPDPRVFLGVPMSSPNTGRAQAERLEALHLAWEWLPARRDLDRFDDALAIASEMPGSALARAVEAVSSRLARAPRRTTAAKVHAGIRR